MYVRPEHAGALPSVLSKLQYCGAHTVRPCPPVHALECDDLKDVVLQS